MCSSSTTVGRWRLRARAFVNACRTPRGVPPCTCSSVPRSLHLLGHRGRPALAALLRRGAVVPTFHLAEEPGRFLDLMQKYADVPMSLADACLVRMSET